MSGNHIFLIGFMGTGKTTIASCFSKKNSMEMVEMDEIIEKREGKSVFDIFLENGEEYFRDLETEVLKELCVQDNKIVSCGGGVVLRKENVSVMKRSGTIVLLTASPQEIFERVKNDNKRPLLAGVGNVEAIKELMNERKARYEEAADITVYTDGKSVGEISEELIGELKRAKERE